MNYTTKEPISCKAVQWNGDNLEEIKHLMSQSNEAIDRIFIASPSNVCVIVNEEGQYMHLDVTDWLVLYEDIVPEPYVIINANFQAKFNPKDE